MNKKVYIVDENNVGLRLDKYVTDASTYSRMVVKKLLDDRKIVVNGKNEKASYKVCLNDKIEVEELIEEELKLEARNLNLEIVYEDDDIAVINKPKGLVVHPAPGHYDDTLVSGLMYQLNSLSSINGVIRPGIVHRLDKDTSGLLIVAKNDEAHNFLVEQLKDHSLRRVYNAICCGVILEEKGKINAPIGRAPNDRLKQAIVENGKPAITNFRVLERFKAHTLVECELETGRTHQIRVHMAYIRKPILGDPLYGPRKVYGDIGQYLHAKRIEFIHPKSKEKMSFEETKTVKILNNNNKKAR